MKKRIKRVISIVLILSLVLSLVACGGAPPTAKLSDSDGQIEVENIEQESIVVENTELEHIYTEFITEEIYTTEIIEAENKITELLLEEETISEVVTCKTIYVPQEHLEDFAKNSQIAGLFGENVDFAPVLKKVAVGTGVIITLVVLKKAGLPEPIASAIFSAADKSLKFAEGGAAIGTLFGGLTGASDEIDQSGRTSAIIGFATAVAGLVLATVSLVTEIPSGGSSTITLAAGIKLVIAGVSVIGATAGTLYAGANAVKTFQATDGTDIDWNNIDWKKAGVSAAEKAINNGADGYMWGSIIGAVYGGADGYDFYQKYNTPYTEYNARLMQTPTNNGRWTGERGESDFILDKPIELPDGTKITKVTYKNAVPDFSPYQKAQVKIPHMTNKRHGADSNFEQANKVLAEYWTKIKYDGKTWTASDVEAFRVENNLTWHEMSNMESMQLVPWELNNTFTHFGGVAEYNAMIGQGGGFDFD